MTSEATIRRDGAVAVQPQRREAPAPVIDARGIRKTYGRGAQQVEALTGVDLHVEPGEFVGVLGPNGAGKTTLIEIIEGIRRPDAGEVRLFGADVSDAAAMKRMRGRMGIALQHSSMPPLMTVAEMLTLQRRLYRSAVDPAQVMDLVGLDEQRNKRVGNLSGGQQQRVAIAMALMGDPQLMILDEPTSQLDPHARLSLWEILYAQRRRREAAVLITTHQMEEAQRICDRVVIVDRGRIIAQGRPDALIRAHFRQRRVQFVTPETLLVEIAGSTHEVRPLRDGKLMHSIVSEAPMELLADLSSRYGAALAEVSIQEPTLEELFLQLTDRSVHAHREAAE